jgi:hypothetical protein
MTFVDISMLLLHWRRSPPAHIAIAHLERNLLGLYGAELREPSSLPAHQPPRIHDESELRALVARVNGG